MVLNPVAASGTIFSAPPSPPVSVHRRRSSTAAKAVQPVAAVRRRIFATKQSRSLPTISEKPVTAFQLPNASSRRRSKPRALKKGVPDDVTSIKGNQRTGRVPPISSIMPAKPACTPKRRRLPMPTQQPAISDGADFVACKIEAQNVLPLSPTMPDITSEHEQQTACDDSNCASAAAWQDTNEIERSSAVDNLEIEVFSRIAAHQQQHRFADQEIADPLFCSAAGNVARSLPKPSSSYYPHVPEQLIPPPSCSSAVTAAFGRFTGPTTTILDELDELLALTENHNSSIAHSTANYDYPCMHYDANEFGADGLMAHENCSSLSNMLSYSPPISSSKPPAPVNDQRYFSPLFVENMDYNDADDTAPTDRKEVSPDQQQNLLMTNNLSSSCSPLQPAVVAKSRKHSDVHNDQSRSRKSRRCSYFGPEPMRAVNRNDEHDAVAQNISSLVADCDEDQKSTNFLPVLKPPKKAVCRTRRRKSAAVSGASNNSSSAYSTKGWGTSNTSVQLPCFLQNFFTWHVSMGQPVVAGSSQAAASTAVAIHKPKQQQPPKQLTFHSISVSPQPSQAAVKLENIDDCSEAVVKQEQRFLSPISIIRPKNDHSDNKDAYFSTSPKTPAAFVFEKQKRKRVETGDILQSRIQKRPERNQLVRQNILKDTNIDSSLQSTQCQLKRAKIADFLNDKISRRPGPLELIKKRILPSDDALVAAVQDGSIRYKATCEGEANKHSQQLFSLQSEHEPMTGSASSGESGARKRSYSTSEADDDGRKQCSHNAAENVADNDADRQNDAVSGSRRKSLKDEYAVKTPPPSSSAVAKLPSRKNSFMSPTTASYNSAAKPIPLASGVSTTIRPRCASSSPVFRRHKEVVDERNLRSTLSSPAAGSDCHMDTALRRRASCLAKPICENQFLLTNTSDVASNLPSSDVATQHRPHHSVSSGKSGLSTNHTEPQSLLPVSLPPPPLSAPLLVAPRQRQIKFHEYRGPPGTAASSNESVCSQPSAALSGFLMFNSNYATDSSKRKESSEIRSSPSSTASSRSSSLVLAAHETVGISDNDLSSYEILLKQQQLYLQWELQLRNAGTQRLETRDNVLSVTSPETDLQTDLSPDVRIHSADRTISKAEPVSDTARGSIAASTDVDAVESSRAVIPGTVCTPPAVASSASDPVKLDAVCLAVLSKKLEELRVSTLKVELKKRNLPVSGPKPTLIGRLLKCFSNFDDALQIISDVKAHAVCDAAKMPLKQLTDKHDEPLRSAEHSNKSKMESKPGCGVRPSSSNSSSSDETAAEKVSPLDSTAIELLLKQQQQQLQQVRNDVGAGGGGGAAAAVVAEQAIKQHQYRIAELQKAIQGIQCRIEQCNGNPVTSVNAGNNETGSDFDDDEADGSNDVEQEIDPEIAAALLSSGAVLLSNDDDEYIDDEGEVDADDDGELDSKTGNFAMNQQPSGACKPSRRGSNAVFDCKRLLQKHLREKSSRSANVESARPPATTDTKPSKKKPGAKKPGATTVAGAAKPKTKTSEAAVTPTAVTIGASEQTLSTSPSQQVMPPSTILIPCVSQAASSQQPQPLLNAQQAHSICQQSMPFVIGAAPRTIETPSALAATAAVPLYVTTPYGIKGPVLAVTRGSTCINIPRGAATMQVTMRGPDGVPFVALASAVPPPHLAHRQQQQFAGGLLPNGRPSNEIPVALAARVVPVSQQPFRMTAVMVRPQSFGGRGDMAPQQNQQQQFILSNNNNGYVGQPWTPVFTSAAVGMKLPTSQPVMQNSAEMFPKFCQQTSIPNSAENVAADQQRIPVMMTTSSTPLQLAPTMNINHLPTPYQPLMHLQQRTGYEPERNLRTPARQLMNDRLTSPTRNNMLHFDVQSVQQMQSQSVQYLAQNINASDRLQQPTLSPLQADFYNDKNYAVTMNSTASSALSSPSTDRCAVHLPVDSSAEQQAVFRNTRDLVTQDAILDDLLEILKDDGLFDMNKTDSSNGGVGGCSQLEPTNTGHSSQQHSGQRSDGSTGASADDNDEDFDLFWNNLLTTTAQAAATASNEKTINNNMALTTSENSNQNLNFFNNTQITYTHSSAVQNSFVANQSSIITAPCSQMSDDVDFFPASMEQQRNDNQSSCYPVYYDNMRPVGVPFCAQDG